jgi:hypothetical protein
VSRRQRVLSQLRRWPALLSFALLAYQLYIPWSVNHLVTQDGPAHLYTAFMAKDLVFHRHSSPYHAVYHIQKSILPNWTCTILLAGIMGVFGPDHAEAFLMSFCLLAGYFSFAYGVRAIAPRASPYWVLGNWLIQSWFLWSGFYNFYLGMALLPAVIGYYVGHASDFKTRRAISLAAGLVMLFFTHLIPTLVAVMALFIVAVWSNLWRREGWRNLPFVAAALVPALSLVAIFAGRSRGVMKFSPEVQKAWESFPQLIFAFAVGRAGEQSLLWPGILLLVAVAALGMRGCEWRSTRGGLAVSALLAFVLYLLIPDSGFGGSAVKMRFAWAVFVLAGLVICSVDRLRPLQGAVGIYVAFLLVCQLTVIQRHVQSASDGVAAYLAATEHIDAGSRFVRMHYPAPGMARRFGTESLAFNPLLHVDALAAVRRHAVDLSDYQSASGTFGVYYKPSVGDGQRYTLWGLESPGMEGRKQLEWLRGNLPVKIDYVVLVGEDGSAQAAGTDMRVVGAELAEKARLEGVNPGAVFVRVYRLE